MKRQNRAVLIVSVLNEIEIEDRMIIHEMIVKLKVKVCDFEDKEDDHSSGHYHYVVPHRKVPTPIGRPMRQASAMGSTWFISPSTTSGTI